MYYQVKSLDPGLYIVSIPIGRARDITLNALDVLSSADFILAEDTRVIKKLLNIYEISVSKVKLLAYHDHNAKKQVPKIMNLLKEGRSIALVSDAGTPLISDPGYLLVKEVTNIDVLVTAPINKEAIHSDSFKFMGHTDYIDSQIDGSAVMMMVSDELKVHGIKNLRIIDASVMPNITSGNTNAPTIMIAEKGADMILNK